MGRLLNQIGRGLATVSALTLALAWVNRPGSAEEQEFRQTIMAAATDYLAEGPGTCGALIATGRQFQKLMPKGTPPGTVVTMAAEEVLSCRQGADIAFPSSFRVNVSDKMGGVWPVGTVSRKELEARARALAAVKAPAP